MQTSPFLYERTKDKNVNKIDAWVCFYNLSAFHQMYFFCFDSNLLFIIIIKIAIVSTEILRVVFFCPPGYNMCTRPPCLLPPP